MTQYVAIIHKDPESDFGVSFPDFPGCITVGTTLDEAAKLAPEALRFHIEGMIEDGEAIPSPSSFEEVMRDANNVTGAAFLVSVPTPSKPVRVNVMLDEALISELNGLNVNRSRFLAAAAWEKIERERRP